MSLELIGIGYSPWTQKARWALDHHRIEYKYSEHLIMVGIPLLRMKTGRWLGAVTAPSLVGPEIPLLDSFSIARWADGQGARETLFPAEHTDAIEAWNEKSDVLLNAARMITTRELCKDTAALAEALPFYLKPLPGSVAVAKQAARYVIRNYALPGDHQSWLGSIRSGLLELREALGNKDYLLGQFSFADVAMAAAVQSIQPPDSQYIPLGPASYRCWSRPDLVAEFADLLHWRKQILEKHGHPFWS
ncbi:MAG: glutathione S-transferase [Flavobacteriaceae bacterium]|jgi:glutathione S-transferase|nr:glutathione S-transferase [Flavobacteriaceae bacterium]